MASTIQVDTIKSTTSNVFFQNSAGTEYARFDSSGNMGIGAASPTSTTKLYVEQSGGGNVLGYFNSTAAAQNARLRINSTDNASSVAYVLSYSHASLNKQFSAYLTGGGNLAFQAAQTAGSEPTSGTTSAIFNQYGIGLGGTAASSGTGIAFPATQSASSDANTLDDYEEGTWSATVAGESGTITAYTVNSATYTKTGDTVYVYLRFTVSNKGTGSNFVVSGLPFTAARELLGIWSETNTTGLTGLMFNAGTGATSFTSRLASSWGGACLVNGSYTVAVTYRV